MSNRWFCYTNSLFDQGLGDHKSISTTWNHFENFLIPFWILKIFCNPKIILKIFVIQIQFWNWFQTIEVQVISKICQNKKKEMPAVFTEGIISSLQWLLLITDIKKILKIQRIIFGNRSQTNVGKECSRFHQ